MKFPDFFLTKSQFYWLLKHQENMIFWPSHEFTWVIQMRNKWLQQSLWQRINIMMTSSNENIFRVTDPLCGEFTGPGGFPTQRPVTRSFDVFFDLRLNKRLSKQPWGWWFETLSWSLYYTDTGLSGLVSPVMPATKSRLDPLVLPFSPSAPLPIEEQLAGKPASPTLETVCPSPDLPPPSPLPALARAVDVPSPDVVHEPVGLVGTILGE